jgi:DNA replication protein DnaC
MPKLAERACEESWSHERFLEAVLSTELCSRESHGGEARIKAARFPSRETLEEFDFTFQRSVKKQVMEHLGQLDFLRGKGNGRSPSRSGPAWPSARRLRHRHRMGRRLGDAKRRGTLEAELRRLPFIPLIGVDEVGYIPFDPEAANLMFSLVSLTLRASVAERDLEQALLGMGRDLRR